MKPALLWLRQDLRLTDHPALCAAASQGAIIPLYILDDETPGPWGLGSASRWWLNQSLAQLQNHLLLVLRKGRADEVITQLFHEHRFSGLYFTRDYAPWSGDLEKRVKDICDNFGIGCHRHSGFLLHEPESIKNGQGEPYKVYTPFSRACFAKGEPRKLKPTPAFSIAEHGLASDQLSQWQLLPTKPNWSQGLHANWQPGEQGAKLALGRFLDEALGDYAVGRDFPAQNHTSRLSAHLHFGEISPNQIWHATQNAIESQGGKADQGGEKFLKELLWREFSYHLLHKWPDLPQKCFKPEYEAMSWVNDETSLQKWQKGQTGYPIVDAGMRELWATGIMHNRVRMIVASFLIKHLQIDWRQGQKWFWDTLVDADIASNTASWQWVAGCGADASPYYRIFNPILQGAKFDPDGTYVRKWVPELANVPNEFVHAPWEMTLPPKAYARPMIDHAHARTRAMAAFASLKQL